MALSELRILIVDDNPDICEALRDLLESQQYAVQSVGSGGAALALVRDQRFAAVVLDLELPDLSGLEVLPQLKASDPTVPVIILTASPGDGNKAAALRDGAAAFLTKPYHREDVLSALSTAVRTS